MRTDRMKQDIKEEKNTLRKKERTKKKNNTFMK